MRAGGKNARAEAEGLKEEISKLSLKTVSTKPTIDGINKILRDAGFQGFHLHEKDGHPNVYEVLRQNGDIAENLSEGELNFIAFLYFYHVVRGSLDDSGMRKDKIVVIDDPVSSMDSNALFIISALVRDMIQICHHYIHPEDTSVGGEFIRQIFVLTHNTYFFKEISYNQVRCYDSVSFFRGEVSPSEHLGKAADGNNRRFEFVRKIVDKIVAKHFNAAQFACHMIKVFEIGRAHV